MIKRFKYENMEILAPSEACAAIRVCKALKDFNIEIPLPRIRENLVEMPFQKLECPHGVYPAFNCANCEDDKEWRMLPNMEKAARMEVRSALIEGDFKTVGEYLKEYSSEIFDVPMSAITKDEK